MLYQAVRGKSILGWVTFPGYITLPSLGNFTKTDVVYRALVWLPSLGMVTQPEYAYPSWVKLPRLGIVAILGALLPSQSGSHCQQPEQDG